MPSVQLQIEQIDKYSFLAKETLLEVPTVTSAILHFENPYTGNVYDIDVTAKWAQMIVNGAVVNISEFPGGQMGDYSYFPDGIYNVTLDVDTQTYESTVAAPFNAIIEDVVAQQTIQSDWKIELNCSCEKYSSTFRKFNYLKMLEFAEQTCLLAEWQEILEALYKLTGTDYEYQSS